MNRLELFYVPYQSGKYELLLTLMEGPCACTYGSGFNKNYKGIYSIPYYGNTDKAS